MDDGTSHQDSYSVRSSRAVSSVDVPHRLVYSGVYELPIGRGRKFGSSMSKAVDLAIGGWQINGIYTLQSGSALGIGANNTAGIFTEAIRANNNGKSAALNVDAHQRLDR